MKRILLFTRDDLRWSIRFAIAATATLIAAREVLRFLVRGLM